MIDTKNTKPSPLEVWLRQDNIEVTCMVVQEDETTFGLNVDSLSMRGAQREITGYLIGDGDEPAGRWQVESNGDESDAETVRRFRLANGAK